MYVLCYCVYTYIVPYGTTDWLTYTHSMGTFCKTELLQCNILSGVSATLRPCLPFIATGFDTRVRYFLVIFFVLYFTIDRDNHSSWSRTSIPFCGKCAFDEKIVCYLTQYSPFVYWQIKRVGMRVIACKFIHNASIHPPTHTNPYITLIYT